MSNLGYLRNFIVNADEAVCLAIWKACNVYGQTLFVVEDDKVIGAFSSMDIPIFHENSFSLTVKNFCQKNFRYIQASKYNLLEAKEIFVKHPAINSVPCLNAKMELVDIIFRCQVFYDEYFDFPEMFNKKLMYHDHAEIFPYMHYADCILTAAKEAKALGYDNISVIEFGVAGGRGLLACELHAYAISKVTGVQIEVYGFDTGAGLPAIRDYRDLPYRFSEGHFKMGNIDMLRDKLLLAQLVIGDIAETSVDFFEKWNPAPVGAMFVDVDFYLSTVSILGLFDKPNDHFLPRVQMYFDDVCPGWEYVGEQLAIKEFNSAHEFIKIAPEAIYGHVDRNGRDFRKGRMRCSLGVCHIFNHPKYAVRLH